jgi:hypothetical protein
VSGGEVRQDRPDQDGQARRCPHIGELDLFEYSPCYTVRIGWPHSSRRWPWWIEHVRPVVQDGDKLVFVQAAQPVEQVLVELVDYRVEHDSSFGPQVGHQVVEQALTGASYAVEGTIGYRQEQARCYW